MFIQLTSTSTNKPIYINTEMIGHMYEVPAKKEYGKEVKEAYTKIGVTTHNNGGFEVAEDIIQIMKLVGIIRN
jgi:hypothetical protein